MLVGVAGYATFCIDASAMRLHLIVNAYDLSNNQYSGKRVKYGMNGLSDYGLVSIGTACKDLLGNIDDFQEAAPFMIRSGIGSLDLNVGGVPYPGVIAVCGGAEKNLDKLVITSLICNLSSDDHAIAILANSPDYSGMAIRLLANRSGLSMETLRSRTIGEEDDDEWSHFSSALSEMLDAAIYIRDMGGDSIPDIVKWLGDIKKSIGISIVIIECSRKNIEGFPERLNEYRAVARKCSYTIIFSLGQAACSAQFTNIQGCDMIINIESPKDYPIQPTTKYKNPVSAQVITGVKHSERIMLEVDVASGKIS